MQIANVAGRAVLADGKEPIGCKRDWVFLTTL
jgi:hypothetical protein